MGGHVNFRHYWRILSLVEVVAGTDNGLSRTGISNVRESPGRVIKVENLKVKMQTVA